MSEFKLSYCLLPLIFIFFMLTSCSWIENTTTTTEDSSIRFTSFVNPFIGSKGNGTSHSEGNTHPGAVTPWGMVAISPQTFDFNTMHLATGFRSGEDKIYGFSSVNLSGVGCPAAGSVPFKFSSRPFNTATRGSSFSNQTAEPGYYSVFLEDEQINVEATATTRSGIYRVNLPKGKNTIYLDLNAQQGHVKGGVIEAYDQTSVAGYQLEGYFCGSTNRNNVYFNVAMNTPADSLFLIYENKTTGFKERLDDKPSGIVYEFNNTSPKTIHIKVGVSFVSIANAKANLDAEQTGFDFDSIRQKADQTWEQELSKIEIRSGSNDDRTVFYSALYRSLLMPFTFSDYNGEYIKQGSKEVGIADGYTRYTAYSMWDTYRTLHPLLTLVYPERELDMVKTMIAMSDESGWLPKWEIFGTESNLMVGDPASIVIGDTYVKGIDQFDVQKAYRAMIKQADQEEGNIFRRGLKEYKALGYIPMDGVVSDVSNFQWNNGIIWGAVSTTMEFNLADYNIAQVARLLEKEEDYKKYMNRSMSFLKLYDPEYGLIRPKNKDGSWYEPFKPDQELWSEMNFGLRGGPGFVEGSAWQYLFSIPHGIDSLKNKMGEEKFLTQLHTIFNDHHFDMTNEPGLGFPFFYNYTRKKNFSTSQKVHELLGKHFSNSVNGLPGNDDAGTMSAWVVFAMMGIYPDTPGNTNYQIASPSFENIKISLNRDFYTSDRFIIKRSGPKEGYINKISLNDSVIGYQVDHQCIAQKNAVLSIKTTERQEEE